MSDFGEMGTGLDAIQQTFKELERALMLLKDRNPTILDRLRITSLLIAHRKALGIDGMPGLNKLPTPEEIEAGKLR